jgi:hypothetical protein
MIEPNARPRVGRPFVVEQYRRRALAELPRADAAVEGILVAEVQGQR